MTDYKFDKFCNLLEDAFILDTYSAYGVMVDFKRLLKDIKSDIYTKIQSGDRNAFLYLGYLINEIDKTDYPKDEKRVSVKKWLDKYQISIEQIFNEDFFNTPFFKVFEVDTYQQNHPNHCPDDNDPYYRDADALQRDFLFYFRWYFAKMLLEFIYSLKENIKPEQPATQLDASYEHQYLDQFCFEIQDIKSLHRNSFLQCYENGILHYTAFLKEELYKNLSHLPEPKAIYYLNFVQTKISNTLFYNTPADYLDVYLLNYDINDMSFPYNENDDVKHYLSSCYNGYHIEYDDRETMYDLQHIFFKYAAMTEAKKMVEFVDQLKAELKTSVNDAEAKTQEDNPPDDDIFTDNGLETLMAIFSHLKITKSNSKGHGNQAKQMSVWDYSKSREMIFKATALKKDYIEYLNKNYNTKISTKSMSDGSKHFQKVKEYLESIKQN